MKVVGIWDAYEKYKIWMIVRLLEVTVIRTNNDWVGRSDNERKRHIVEEVEIE